MTSRDDELQYKFYDSKVIVDNYDQFVKLCEKAHKTHQEHFQGLSSTATYNQYNFLTIGGTNPIMWSLIKELKSFIFDYLTSNNYSTDNTWIQCWINFHKPEEVLDWHTHLAKHHGYISVRPHNTQTLFYEHDIAADNHIGMVYIGPGHHYHKVEVLEHFDTPRITVAFDVHQGDTGGPNYIPLV